MLSKSMLRPECWVSLPDKSTLEEVGGLGFRVRILKTFWGTFRLPLRTIYEEGAILLAQSHNPKL